MLNRRYISKSSPSGYRAGDDFDAEGSFHTCRYQNDEGFVIGSFFPRRGESIVCKGIVPGFVLGAPYHVTGTVVDDRVWGMQVKIKGAAPVVPTGDEEIVAFLGSGLIPGVGPSTAKRIQKKFGDDTLRILQEEPERLIEVSGIGKKTLPKIVETIPKVLSDRETIGYFAKFGISTRTINTLIREYGSGAKDIVNENPYVLCKVRGFAFTRADSIAQKLGVSPTDPNRIYAGLIASLRWSCQSQGNTMLPREDLVALAEEKLRLPEVVYDGDGDGRSAHGLVEESLDRLVHDKRLMEDADGVHLNHLYKAEQRIRKRVESATRHPSVIATPEQVSAAIAKSLAKSGAQLTEEQSQAVANAFGARISIITGQAGAGKSFLCATMVDAARRCGVPVCLLSPTGRAAKHLSEVCGEPGFTVHRALSIAVRADQDDDFFSDATDVVKQSAAQSSANNVFRKSKLVIADEASMIDTEMAAILLDACKSKNLVLVGDPNQLPSVGPGKVLADLIDSGICNYTVLTKVFRQGEGSPVIRAADAVRAGKSPVGVDGVPFYQASGEEVLRIIQHRVLPTMRHMGLGRDDVMFITPIKKTPYCGVNALNDFLRPRLNDQYRVPEHESHGLQLQKGDWVAQTRNNYDVDVFNGDIGVVVGVDQDRNVRVHFADTDYDVEFGKDEVSDNLMLAYASTVHRQQGSQARMVIVICTNSQFPLLSRNMLYTAVTRAERYLVLIGDAKAFAVAAGNAKERKRITGLGSLGKGKR